MTTSMYCWYVGPPRHPYVCMYVVNFKIYIPRHCYSTLGVPESLEAWPWLNTSLWCRCLASGLEPVPKSCFIDNLIIASLFAHGQVTFCKLVARKIVYLL